MSLFTSRYAKFYKDGEIVITDMNDLYIGSLFEEEAKELYEAMKEHFEKEVPNKIIYRNSYITAYESGDILISPGDRPVTMGKPQTMHLLTVLKQYFIDGGWSPNDFITIEWHIDDVLTRAAEMGAAITEEDARDVLEKVKDTHDANEGVNWEVLSFWIDSLFSNGGKLKGHWVAGKWEEP